MFKKLFKTEHVKTTQLAIKELLKRNNENIKANVSGYSAPKKVIKKATGDGFFPDITTVKGGQFRLFAVETIKTINNEAVKEKWSLFEKFASQNQALFFIVFPKGIFKEIKKRVDEAEIEAQLWEI